MGSRAVDGNFTKEEYLLNELGLFAKFWQPGRVKTRLAADLDEKASCLLYQHFLSHLINQLEQVGDCRTIVYSPADRTPEFQTIAGTRWQTTPQAAGDLGQRMKAFFDFSLHRVSDSEDSVDSTVRKTVVIGSDCPQLTAGNIQQAFDRLEEEPVVLGPTDDGGYYLIGMRDECFGLFDDIDWSTDQVLTQTRARLRSLGVGWTELDQKSDIDTLKDLLVYHADAIATSQLGSADFNLQGAIAGVLAGYPNAGGKS